MLIPEEYPIHPVAFLSPDKTADEQAQLVEDIKEHRQLVPIVRWRGWVIDGRHRLAACLEAGVAPRFEDVDDDAHPGELFLSLVGRQRKMTVSQLAALAVELARWSTRGRPRAGEEDDPDLRVITQEEAARMLGISRSQVTQARRVFSEESPAVEELRRAVINGLVTINAAAAAAKHPPEVQRAALELVTGGKARSLSATIPQVNNEIALGEDADALASSRAQSLEDAVTLHAASVGDMSQLVQLPSVAWSSPTRRTRRNSRPVSRTWRTSPATPSGTRGCWWRSSVPCFCRTSCGSWSTTGCGGSAPCPWSSTGSRSTPGGPISCASNS